MAKEYHTWDTVTKKTVLPSQAEAYLKTRDGPAPKTLPKPRAIKVKFPGTCGICHKPVLAGSWALMNPFITNEGCPSPFGGHLHSP